MRSGVDVSSAQHPAGQSILWQQVAAAGIDWAAVKLTENRHYVNPFAEGDVHGARSAGLEVVGYHFARPHDNTPTEEADNFAATFHAVGGGMRLALDVEDGRQLGWKTLAEWVRAFVAATAVDYLYWNRDYAHHLGPLLDFPTNRQWIAWPGGAPDSTPYAVVQYGQGHVPGIIGPVDLDHVNEPHPTAPPAAPSAQPAADDPVPPTISRHRPGSSAAVVRRLQGRLNAHTFHLSVDGNFGALTEGAVRAFQREHHLSIDGIVGPATWKALG